jgi:uncharacterized SAM-binding protein YcdF (DUF218 family)
LPQIGRRRLLVALVLLVLVFILALPAIARGLGTWLVETAEAAPADAALVLAGDFRCNRVLRAGELVRAGFVRAALVSSPGEIYGVPEGELAVACAVRRGHSRDWFEVARIRAMSTVEEAEQLAPLLACRGVRQLLIVTSESHTRRAGRVFRARLGPDVAVRMIGVPDPYFRADSWWKHHEGREIVFIEWSKTVATALGL